MGENIPRTSRLEERKSSFEKEKCFFFYGCATVNDWYFIFTFGSVIVYGCFISKARWKYSLFIRFSHWRNLELRYFVGYSFGTSRLIVHPKKEKGINHFLGHSLQKKVLYIGWKYPLTRVWKYNKNTLVELIIRNAKGVKGEVQGTHYRTELKMWISVNQAGNTMKNRV